MSKKTQHAHDTLGFFALQFITTRGVDLLVILQYIG